MKRFKKLTALFVALAMMVALIPSAFADDPITTYKLTIDGTEAGHTYDVYQIFTGDISGDGTTEKPYVLSNVKWGSSIDSYDNSNVTKGSDATAIAEKITESGLNDFISKLGLGTAVQTGVTSTANSTVISGLAPGYYLVIERTITGEGTLQTATKDIVQVVGDTTVNVKKETVESYKKVKDINDSTDVDCKFKMYKNMGLIIR